MNIFKMMLRKARKKSSCIIFAIVFINIMIVFLLQTNSSLRQTFEKTFRFQLSPHSSLDSHLQAGKYRTDQRPPVSVEEFRAGVKTGNPLIDGYGRNNLSAPGEMGLAVRPREDEKNEVDKVMAEFHINTLVSDRIPLNRMVPDSRLKGCEELVYRTEDLPSASIIIPFYDEWPSVLIRTIYSVINRSPRRNLQEIILVDDASTLKELKAPLDHYILREFPQGLVRIIRLPQRRGLTQARLVGSREAIGDVLIFFDSHMEVNIGWLPPLLTEISQDRRVVAMATLDYIQPDTFMYKFNLNYLTRYGWSWDLLFFETHFRTDQVGPDVRNHRNGVTMVGAGFAIDRTYFKEIGEYDSDMQIWGGENLELSWRVWLCGGRLLHAPCSRIGHVPRMQPYSFPGGRPMVLLHNYKRAATVWMGNYTRFVYSIFPEMQTLDVGDVSERLALKTKLGCKDFSWYLQNIWPELNVYDENATVWGQVKNVAKSLCLDNKGHLFQNRQPLILNRCKGSIHMQGFSLTSHGLLRTTLQCAVGHESNITSHVQIEDCIIGSRDKWSYTQNQRLVHVRSGLCLDIDQISPVLRGCDSNVKTQEWTFQPYVFT